MNLSLGIVGLPNVGKSTLFNTLTNISVPAENYLFCTIEPNIGIVPIPDTRLQTLAKIVNSKNVIAPVIKFVDIAGLVKGAHKGEGLGNQFLANIRETNAIVQIIRIFESKEILHIENRIDPLADKEIIETELILKDLELLDNKILKIKNEVKRDKKNEKYYELLLGLKENLEKGNFGIAYRNQEEYENDDVSKYRKELALLTDKPLIYILNTDEVIFDKDKEIKKFKRLFKINDNNKIILLNIKQEYEISCLNSIEKEEMKKELGLEASALDNLIRDSYCILGLMTFFTAGEKEVRGWTVEIGTRAPQAAGVIHTDFEKKFIAAEVVSYEDFVKYNGWLGVKNSGKIRAEGRGYVFKEGDVAIFKHGA